MKVLVVGGTGLIGGHTALALAAQGHDVTIAARQPASPAAAIAHFPFLAGDYAADTFTQDMLAPFDGLVFAAGNDFRHVPAGANETEHLDMANATGVPRFFVRARDAGVKRAVLVGTFYPQVAPDTVQSSPYVRSRFLADEGARALASPDFAVCSVNPPFVLGTLEGIAVLGAPTHARYALGQFPDMPVFAIPGGTNFMSAHAVSQAVAGALERGKSGHAYLVGDRNLTFRDYFQLLFDAAGNPAPIAIADREHPLFPDAMLYAGRGTDIVYEADPAERALLGYHQGDLDTVIAQIIESCREP